jgi:PhzF family phenazine biosynthesis protein
LHADDEIVVASPGRERLLVPIANRAVLAGIHPDQPQLAAASRRFGQLGCFVYVPPSDARLDARPAAARMFAPAIGVPEDVANANSSGCLAAHLLVNGRNSTVTVDQGDALGRPSTVWATAFRTPLGIATRVGGTARVLAAPAQSPWVGSGNCRDLSPEPASTQQIPELPRKSELSKGFSNQLPGAQG